MALKSIAIKQFKCFKEYTLDLSPLTLLTGYNAAGKSSSIQPILLLAQAARTSLDSRILELNGPMVRIGTAAESLSDQATDKAIHFCITTDALQATWIFETPEELRSRFLEIKSINIKHKDGRETSAKNRFYPESLTTSALKYLASTIYLGAARVAPTDAYPVSDLSSVYSDVGVAGQYAASWYAKLADEEVAIARRHPRETGLTLRRQLDAFFGDLFPGAQANAETIPRTGLARLVFRTSQTSDWLRPANVGFGLSYVFPLLVAILLAKPGQQLIIDSPEAHLHPAVQSVMGRLLTRVAASGVQLIVETHSDHILNGVRLGVRDCLIQSTDVSLNFFSSFNDDGPRVSQIRIDKNGSIENWPSGFFDQADLDITSLVGFR